jgi:cell division protein FtsB
MFDFYQKRKIRAIVNSRYTQGVIVFLTLLVAWSAYVRFDIAREMNERRELAEIEANELEVRRDELQEQIDYLSNERGIEAEMRRQFDIAREGEQVVVILDDETEESEIEPLATSTNESTSSPWYQFWR